MANDLRKVIVDTMVDKGLGRREILLALSQRIEPNPRQARPEETMIYRGEKQQHQVTATVFTTYEAGTPAQCYNKDLPYSFECESKWILSQQLGISENGVVKGILVYLPAREYSHLYENGKGGFGREVSGIAEGIGLLLSD